MNQLLDELRQVMPPRRLTMREALILAERQATVFLRISGIDEAPVPSSLITDLTFVHARVMPAMNVSGATKWMKPRWFILLNGIEPALRQRFSLAHEFKHLLDHPMKSTVYGPLTDSSSRRRVESVCDFFAGCLLVPRPWLKRAYCSGLQDVRELAEYFDVSEQAMQVRLSQVGLVDDKPRCAFGNEVPYFRQPSSVLSHPLAA